MIDLLTGREAQRLVLCCTFFYILSNVGLGWTDPEWWCMFAILMVLEYLSWQRGREDGVMMTLSLADEDMKRIQKQIKQIEEEEEK